jgi:hypothetical protein
MRFRKDAAAGRHVVGADPSLAVFGRVVMASRYDRAPVEGRAVRPYGHPYTPRL